MKIKKAVPMKTIFMVLAIAVFVLIIPRATNNYSITVMNTALIYSITALGLTMLLGMSGMMSMASVSFMGIGAFTTAQLSKNFHWPSLLALAASVAVAAVISLLLGAVLLKLKGSYFTFATIAFAQIVNTILINFKPFTEGIDGMSGVPPLDLGFMVVEDKKLWFYVLMLTVILCALLVERIRRTSLGRSLAAIRDNETAAKTLGVNVFRTRLIVFTLAGAFAGLSGSLFAQHNSFVSPSLFGLETQNIYTMMIMLGGVNSTAGTCLGAILVTMLPEWMRPLQRYLKLIYGICVILLMIFMPMGIAGVVENGISKLKRKFKGKGGKGNDDSSDVAAVSHPEA